MDPNQQPQYPEQPQQQNGYQQPQQYPQGYQQQPMPQPVDGYQPPHKEGGLNIKMMLIGAGVFLGLIGLLTIIAASSGGGSDQQNTAAADSALPLEPYQDADNLPFAVQLPQGWSTELFSYPNYAAVVSTPEQTQREDPTGITIGLNSEQQTPQQHIENAELFLDELRSSEFDQSRGYSVSNITSENYGTTDSPAFRITYTRIDESSQAQAETEAYLIYRPADGSQVNATFTYTEGFSDLEGSINVILQSITVD